MLSPNTEEPLSKSVSGLVTLFVSLLLYKPIIKCIYKHKETPCTLFLVAKYRANSLRYANRFCEFQPEVFLTYLYYY